LWAVEINSAAHSTSGYLIDDIPFERIKLPDDKILAPGVIDVTNTNNYVEQPEVVVDRLECFANVVGRERVIASNAYGEHRTVCAMSSTVTAYGRPDLR